MPRGDSTGPAGMGPMTGRGAGYCAGFNVPGYANPAAGTGRGLARGFRGGRGSGAGRRLRGPMGPPPASVRQPQYVNTPATEEEAREQEVKNLKRTAEDLEDQLEAVRDRINQLQAE